MIAGSYFFTLEAPHVIWRSSRPSRHNSQPAPSRPHRTAICLCVSFISVDLSCWYACVWITVVISTYLSYVCLDYWCVSRIFGICTLFMTAWIISACISSSSV